MNHNRRLIRAITAIFAVLVLLFADIAAATAPADVSRAISRSQIVAKSNKKKKKSNATATPTAAPEATPAPGEEAADPGVTPIPEGPIIDPQSIADYLFANGCLPENFITKKQAQALGWDSTWNYVSDVAPGMSIGGDYFGNYEGILPTGRGIQYHEADCWYKGGKRNAYRIIFSSDGRVWYTADHYNTFTELFPTWTRPEVTPIPDPTLSRR